MEEWAGKQAREDEVVLTAELDTEEVRDGSEAEAADGVVQPSGAEAGAGTKSSPAVDVSQRESRLHLSGKPAPTAEQGTPGSVIGPAEAAPHWREFYGAVRAAVQGMRGGE
ncbi:hypothetical protein [Paenibacillus sp. CF384]|uniref:hypothetical protein n=1 Tax=Paenibacillus sp. CF384 TaxID=1884382 RepID=UPI0008964983|nr:hypothetical protein [Paenibacillus sp. CF384]SDW79264.1 hypothetical protein SAMN05518855_1005126 [Paenibacillus sp. CF384]